MKKSCTSDYCMTKDPSSFFLCPNCLLINFPRLDIEDLYEMFAKSINVIDELVEAEKFSAFTILSPGEVKEDIFNFYNKLILKKTTGEY